jgi:azurin
MTLRALAAVIVVTATAVSGIGAQTPAKKATPPSKGAAGRIIQITGDDTMKYNVVSIAAKPGEQLTIRLTNKGTMPKLASAHNFVLLKLGTKVSTFTMAAGMAQATDYIPSDPKNKALVLASTKLAGPGETVEVTFKAPAAPGAYDYLCSFPGHFATMVGKLTIAR